MKIAKYFKIIISKKNNNLLLLIESISIVFTEYVNKKFNLFFLFIFVFQLILYKDFC